MKNNQTVEDLTAREIWYILQKIRSEELVTAPFKKSAKLRDYSCPIPVIGIEVSFPVLLQSDVPNPARTMKIMSKLVSDKCIRLGEFERPSGYLIYTIRLCQPKFDEVYEKYKEMCFIEKRGDPQFRFDQGVLFRDGCQEVEKFKEASIEYALIRSAMLNPVGERLEARSSGLDDYGWESVEGAARRLNDKIFKKFRVSDFFRIDYTDKYLVRNQE